MHCPKIGGVPQTLNDGIRQHDVDAGGCVSDAVVAENLTQARGLWHIRESITLAQATWAMATCTTTCKPPKAWMAKSFCATTKSA